jgi:hypothetical protein
MTDKMLFPSYIISVGTDDQFIDMKPNWYGYESEI